MNLKNQSISDEQRDATMMWLAKCGYSTTRQIALGVFSACTANKRRLASRQIARLIKQGLLVHKREGLGLNGERLVALSKRGLKFINEVLPKEKPDGREWLRHAHSHRTNCNSAFLACGAMLTEDLGSCYTELEIKTGNVKPTDLRLALYKFDSERVIEQKQPDGLIKTPSGWVWLEVENSYRSSVDFAKCIDWLRCIIGRNDIHEVWFVVTAPGANTIQSRLTRALKPRTDGLVEGRSRKALEDDKATLNRIKFWYLNHDDLTLHKSRVDVTQ